MKKDSIDNTSYFKIQPHKGLNLRLPYEHQKAAMHNMDQMDTLPSYHTLIVLPTGGGKTYTASMWLLKNAVANKKKILWIAHRTMLLDQAADSFIKYAYTELMPRTDSFTCRIISGSSSHGRTSDIRPTDNVLIISKDSIGRNLDRLAPWLEGEDELYFVVDEAHHSTAKTYRKIIDYVKERIPHLKLIGLTATPFRTAEEEKGLLSHIYTDGMYNQQPTRGATGIAYQIGLKELIRRQILSQPIFESYYTDENYGESAGLSAWESIQYLDLIPDSIAEQMAKSAARNKLIVDTYKAGQAHYGQTIIFAVNIVHAFQLCSLFKKAGIKAAYVVSNIRDLATGCNLSKEDNEKHIADFRSGKIQVLVNVNILTEGVDLPQTQTIFLARPTISTILMTQMIGRALRGSVAGGTDTSYIVSFIDNWSEHIAWVNPESLIHGDPLDIPDSPERQARDIRLIALSKIEEFARILDDSVDTTLLEKVPFTQRLPVGMYSFSYLEPNGMDISYQVMVYSSNQKAYAHFMTELPSLFASYGIDDEYLSDTVLNTMEKQCRQLFFRKELFPPYEKKDTIQILKYYAQYGCVPSFYTFDAINRQKLDLSRIAAHIWDANMGRQEEARYIDELWHSGDDHILRLLYTRKLYFKKLINIEIAKLAGDYDDVPTVTMPEKKYKEDLSLHDLWHYFPQYAEELVTTTYSHALDEEGYYHCAHCDYKDPHKVFFQIDHIVAMNNKGKSIPENLQILCRRCNGIKGDNK